MSKVFVRKNKTYSERKKLGFVCDTVIVVTVILIIVIFIVAITKLERSNDSDTDNETDSANTHLSVPSSGGSGDAYVNGKNGVDMNVSFEIDSVERSSYDIVWSQLQNRSLSTLGASVIDVGVQTRCEPSWSQNAFCASLLLRFANRSAMETFITLHLDSKWKQYFVNRAAFTRRDDRQKPFSHVRWNTAMFFGNDNSFTTHLHSWSTSTKTMTYMYRDSMRQSFDTITVDMNATWNSAASDEANYLEVLIVPDATPYTVLHASPVWQEALDLRKYDRRLTWTLFGEKEVDEMNSLTLSTTSNIIQSGSVNGTFITRILVNTESRMWFNFELQDSFGYGLCMPVQNRYVHDTQSQDQFTVEKHDHFGFFTISSFGHVVDSGASFSQVPALQAPRTFGISRHFSVPHPGAVHLPSCSVTNNSLYSQSFASTNFQNKSTNQTISIGARVDTSSRVVGGDPVVTHGLYGFMVSIQRAYDKDQNSMHAHLCGGALISPDLVLTAAHCVYNEASAWPTRANCFTGAHHVDIGRITLTDSADLRCIEEIPIVDVYVHPQYNPRSLSFDVALLRLASKSSYPPINVYDPKDLSQPRVDLSKIVVSSLGWGHTAYRGHMSDDLMLMNTFVYDRDQCRKNYANVVLSDGSKARIVGVEFGDHNFCAYHKIDNTVIDNCQGDSGGAMFFEVNNRYYVIGVVSFGYECAYRYSIVPGVYANVTHVADWIRLYTSNRTTRKRKLIQQFA
eukprot:gene142-235_t